MTALISILATALLVQRIAIYYIDRKNKQSLKRLHALEMKLERNKQLYAFRMRLLHEFGSDITEAMPEHRQMLDSDKPLVASEWVDVDKLVNLN